jgi:hypothetical protein
MNHNLIDKKECATRLHLTVRGVSCLMKQRKIPYLKISKKLVRFDWPEVEAALEKFTVNSVG